MGKERMTRTTASLSVEFIRAIGPKFFFYSFVGKGSELGSALVLALGL